MAASSSPSRPMHDIDTGLNQVLSKLRKTNRRTRSEADVYAAFSKARQYKVRRDEERKND